MRAADDFLVDLVDSLLQGSARSVAEQGLSVTSIDLDLPIEHRVSREAGLELSLPRGVLDTGFLLPHGRLRLHIETHATSEPQLESGEGGAT